MPSSRHRRTAAVLALGAAALATSGCIGADTDVNGALGVTVGDAGRPVLVAEVCHGSVQSVGVYGPARGNQPNEALVELTAAEAVSGSFTLDLAAPGEAWEGEPAALPLGPDLHVAVASGSEEADSQLSQVEFTAEDLASLQPGQVLSGRSEEPVDAGAFADLACDGR